MSAKSGPTANSLKAAVSRRYRPPAAGRALEKRTPITIQFTGPQTAERSGAVCGPVYAFVGPAIFNIRLSTVPRCSVTALGFDHNVFDRFVANVLRLYQAAAGDPGNLASLFAGGGD